MQPEGKQNEWHGIRFIMPPSKVRTQFEQGLGLFHRGEYEKAISYFEDVVLEEPENSESLYNLACCYAMTDQADNALMYLDRAIKLNPHCLDWAREDHEFEQVRDNPYFIQIVTGEFPESEAEPALVKSEEIPQPPGVEEFPSPQGEEPSQFQEVNVQQYNEEWEEEVPQQSKEPPPKLQDSRQKSFVPEISDLPACTRCDGLVQVERRSRFNPVLMLFVIYIGVLCMTTLVFSFWGLIGLPVILIGFYYLSQIYDVWICQNCGATGKDCGQPAKDPQDRFNSPS